MGCGSDLDYIFLYKDDLQDFFNRDFDHLLSSNYNTYKKEDFGFTTQNEETIIYTGNFDQLDNHYVAAVDDTDPINLYSVLYITITNNKTKQEKTFRKDFSGSASSNDVETLVRLITGNWDYTYNH